MQMDQSPTAIRAAVPTKTKGQRPSAPPFSHTTETRRRITPTAQQLGADGPAAQARIPSTAWKAVREALESGPVLVQVAPGAQVLESGSGVPIGDERIGFNHFDGGWMAYVCFADGRVETLYDPSADPDNPDLGKREKLSKWYGSGGINRNGSKNGD